MKKAFQRARFHARDGLSHHSRVGLKISDHYQVMSAAALVDFWTLVLAAYTFLDEERQHLCDFRHEPATLGDARRALYQRYQAALVGWICEQHDCGQSASAIAAFLAA